MPLLQNLHLPLTCPSKGGLTSYRVTLTCLYVLAEAFRKSAAGLSHVILTFLGLTLLRCDVLTNEGGEIGILPRSSIHKFWASKTK